MKQALNYTLRLVKLYPKTASVLLLSGWLLVTILVGTDAENRGFVFSVMASLGTVVAALAALWTTYLARLTLDKQVKQELENKQPSLVLSNVSVDIPDYDDYRYVEWTKKHVGKFRFNVELTNLGAYPVYVKSIQPPFDNYDYYITANMEGVHDKRGFLVAPNESALRTFESELDFTEYETYESDLVCWFIYGPTGRKIHSLRATVSMYSYDMDGALEGWIEVKNGEEIYRRDVDFGYNHNRLPRDENDRVIRNS